MTSELKKLKNNFKKKFGFTEEQINKLRWHEVTTNPKYVDLLPAFNELRIKFVQGLLKNIIDKQIKCQDCFLTIAGSVGLTSDYDATVSSISTFEKVAELFNDQFEKLWGGVTSAEIFDTNIYAIGYFTELPADKKIPAPFKRIIHRQNKDVTKEFMYLKCIKGKSNCDLDLKNQTTWAFLQYIKLQKLYAPKYKRKDILGSMVTIPNYGNYEKLYYKRIEKTDVKDVKAMNKKYIAKIKKVKKYYKSIARTVKPVDLVTYKDMIAHAMFFGNETYLTQGSFFHVVGLMQMKMAPMAKIITREELIHSIIENFSYLYMEYQMARDKYYFFSLSAKYLVRILDAIERINNTIGKFSDIQFLLMDAKKARRKESHDIVDKVLMEMLFRDFNITNKQNATMLDIMIGLVNFFNSELDDFPFIVKKPRDSLVGFNYELESSQDDDEQDITKMVENFRRDSLPKQMRLFKDSDEDDDDLGPRRQVMTPVMKAGKKKKRKSKSKKIKKNKRKN